MPARPRVPYDLKDEVTDKANELSDDRVQSFKEACRVLLQYARVPPEDRPEGSVGRQLAEDNQEPTFVSDDPPVDSLQGDTLEYSKPKASDPEDTWMR